ncbi:DUF4835 family protein [Pseudoflavitalea sp. G-6-1-2]|uniref:type IX secretion system protein PorD n=1 Tax=Pseudoflavitalea sp. G-6-1-2 TaxID=2728841 RepID=UPI00146B122E|nr:DUF4835 family protein [Pseudoflavitalea sp. G-6-1-2]NML22662.1 DUF4835 family protein [Pseudoflavitalea sp. G-6-1-2]
MRKPIILILLIAALPAMMQAQELNARVSINASRVSSQTDKKIFQTLQAAINNLLNNRKWTGETFQTNEKINCNFLLNIAEAQPGNIYKATLTVQAARPVFNTTYETPLINFLDDNVTFKYVEFQPFEFNENRISGGSDPLAANLSAVFGYYVYMILGLDFNSFAPRGGAPYFQKAQNVVNNAPENRDIQGWKAFDGLRNRYWLVENLVNNRYNAIHDAVYSYYRLGMDHLYENENEGRTAILNTLGMLNSLNNDISNTMIIPFFLQGKSAELVRVFKKANPDEKQKARDILIKIDIANANTYKQELK